MPAPALVLFHLTPTFPTFSISWQVFPFPFISLWRFYPDIAASLFWSTIHVLTYLTNIIPPCPPPLLLTLANEMWTEVSCALFSVTPLLMMYILLESGDWSSGSLRRISGTLSMLWEWRQTVKFKDLFILLFSTSSLVYQSFPPLVLSG